MKFRLTALTALAFVLGSYSIVCAAEAPHSTGWPVCGGQLANDHYSPLTQINRSNVHKLRVAWTFDTGEKGPGFESSPLIVGGVLYAPTPTEKVIALNAASGKLLWTFDPGFQGTRPTRGLAYWSDGADARLFAGVMQYLYALDPATGKTIPTFGEGGRIDLRKGLGRDYKLQSISLNTPGIVYKDLIIVGGEVPESHPAPPGDIRAFDVHTGALRWAFHTIPHPGEFGYDTWPKDAWKNAGSANNWAGMAIDPKRGIVYVPTGSAVSDFYGGDRVGDDLFADTLLALDAETGKRIWHFQGVHHDIFDRDFPSAPSLVTLVRDGSPVDAIAQVTKQGYVYLFNRINGHPLFPIVEQPVPPSDVPGEVASPTQPKPLVPAPFARQLLTEQMLTDRTPEAHAFALEKFKTFRSAGQFVPLSLNKQTVVFPGFDGGAEWGGAAVDPGTGVIYINSNEMAWTGGLTEYKGGTTEGEKFYQLHCAVCHGEDRQGSPPAFPSLIGVDKRLSDTTIKDTILHGRGRMPSFPMLRDRGMQALLDYLKSSEAGTAHEPSGDKHAMDAATPTDAGIADTGATKYQFTGYRQFLDQDGYPAIQPPWGTLNAIDLNTGKYLWKIPLGEYPALAAKGIRNTGSENYGGPIVTAGGIVLIGATLFDRKMHAFDSSTGQLLWETTMPFAGAATPATYMVDGKQYVVIAAGGGKYPGQPSGGEYIAFRLP